MKIDLHTHTIASGHAFSSLGEMVKMASKKGIKVLAITDHGPSIVGAPPVSYFKCGHRFPDVIDGVRVLFGVEANILDGEGTLDLSKSVLKKLDIVMAGFHDFDDLGIDKNTQAMVNAMENPLVKMISHPYKSTTKIDIEKIAFAAVEHDVLLEINASFFYKNTIKDKEVWEKIKKMVETLKRHNKKLIINSDAHSAFEVGRFNEVKNKFSEMNLSKNDLLNSDAKRIFEFFEIKNV